MSKEEKSNALMQFAPVGAPLVGVVLAIVFILAIVMTSNVSENKDTLQKTITQVSTRMASTEVNPPDWGEIPLADAVPATLDVAPENSWQPKPVKELLALPVLWQVEMDGAPEDAFQAADLNKDNFWDKTEFERTTHYPKTSFTQWDRDNDGRITREEFNNPPVGVEDQFAKLDLDASGDLSAPDEITDKQAYDWDRQDPDTGEYDGRISLDEFTNRFGPRDERDLGAVSNVQAAVDTSTMQIVVTWDAPQVGKLPEDTAYYIERFAPETFEERMSVYRRDTVPKYMEELQAWKGRFDAWWNDSTPQANGKTRKQTYSRRDDAEKKYTEETGDAKPLEPEEPGPWEPVTDESTLATNTEYRDTTFRAGVTYTYAVRMVTQKPVRDQPKTRELAGLGGKWNGYPDRKIQEGRPVLVRNRVSMRWKSQAGDSATVTLTRWHRVGDDWYKIRITRTLAQNDMVGEMYTKSQLSDHGGVMIDVSGAESDLTALPDDARVDFSTGFSYVANTPKGFLFTSREVGDFELPKATSQEPAEQDDALGKDNPMEIRALTVKNGGAEGVFEVTRWHKVGDEWLRVVWQKSIKKGGAVGAKVALSSPGSDVTVWDASGKEVASSTLKKYADQTVDLSGGSYEELDARTVVVGGGRLDLFGTLYKE
ncbi:MAG: hypothetical protein K8I27_05920 [Planctomycetes bacterium]|nr:hypothetical protein [Planctomycetota bacterium]